MGRKKNSKHATGSPRRRVDKKEFRKQQKAPYSLDELEHFYEACFEVYSRIVHQRPTVVVAPLRGADPIIKTVRLIASLERKSYLIPKIVYPRTGEQHDIPLKQVYDKVPQDLQRSMSEKQKEKELLDMVGRELARTKKKAPVIFLVDEAFSGGSITQHYRLLAKLNAEWNWRAKIVAISVITRQSPKSREYLRLVHAKKIRQLEIPWLFTTDSAKFLYPLIGKKKDLLSFIRRHVIRPHVALSRRALHGRQQLLADVSEAWSGKWTSKGLKRLPITKKRFRK